jgi:hypothetical protein
MIGFNMNTLIVIAYYQREDYNVSQSKGVLPKRSPRTQPENPPELPSTVLFYPISIKLRRSFFETSYYRYYDGRFFSV